jgi:hypothetical protein
MGTAPRPLGFHLDPSWLLDQLKPLLWRRVLDRCPRPTVPYTVAAWGTAPGFYDGFAPTAPYNWVSPPSQFQVGNKPPASGHMAVKVTNGATSGIGVATDDGQAQLVLPEAAFQVTATAEQVTVDIQPAARFPSPTFQPATNVYLISASAPLAKAAEVLLRYSGQIAPPADVYSAAGGGTSWASVPTRPTSAQYFMSISTRTLGYFVAGDSRATGGGGGQGQGSANGKGPPMLPLVVGGTILVVLLLGLTALLLRLHRGPRRGPRKRPAPASAPPTGQPATLNKGGARRRKRGKR